VHGFCVVFRIASVDCHETDLHYAVSVAFSLQAPEFEAAMARGRQLLARVVQNPQDFTLVSVDDEGWEPISEEEEG
jgi:hypothetical protein